MLLTLYYSYVTSEDYVDHPIVNNYSKFSRDFPNDKTVMVVNALSVLLEEEPERIMASMLAYEKMRQEERSSSRHIVSSGSFWSGLVMLLVLFSTVSIFQVFSFEKQKRLKPNNNNEAFRAICEAITSCTSFKNVYGSLTASSGFLHINIPYSAMGAFQAKKHAFWFMVFHEEFHKKTYYTITRHLFLGLSMLCRIMAAIIAALFSRFIFSIFLDDGFVFNFSIVISFLIGYAVFMLFEFIYGKFKMMQELLADQYAFQKVSLFVTDGDADLGSMQSVFVESEKAQGNDHPSVRERFKFAATGLSNLGLINYLLLGTLLFAPYGVIIGREEFVNTEMVVVFAFASTIVSFFWIKNTKTMAESNISEIAYIALAAAVIVLMYHISELNMLLFQFATGLKLYFGSQAQHKETYFESYIMYFLCVSFMSMPIALRLYETLSKKGEGKWKK